jgi:predicted membrane protein DUF2207
VRDDPRVDVPDLIGRDADLALLACATGALWIAGAAILYASRHPAEPPVGPRTLELGPEPPAIANFLVHDFRVTDEAVAATLIDLAARRVAEIEQRGPGLFWVRLRSEPGEELTAYERRVLEHLRKLASLGAVPAEALTTGPEEESSRWRKEFEREVVADAQRRGLSRDAYGETSLLVLTGAAAVPALATVPLGGFGPGALIMVAAFGIVGWMRARFPQRETDAGLGAASRWLGVRAELAANEVFPTYSPLTVPLWDRLLAYGAALGVATGASAPLPLGAESDTHAWSAHGGRWRPVRVSYPRVWPPGWGLDPRVALVGGVGATVLGGYVLYTQGVRLFEDAGVVQGAYLVALCGAVVLGIAVAVMGVQDQWTSHEVTGPILRLRAFGDDDEKRYFAAVDDGTSRSIRAWRLEAEDFGRLRQGQLVTVTSTPNLGRVRSIEPAPDWN